jgi:hypothetical protein
LALRRGNGFPSWFMGFNGVSYSSGQLNAKQRELLELQALAQRRLKGARANFAEGMKAAKETKRDLEWTHKRVR